MSLWTLLNLDSEGVFSATTLLNDKILPCGHRFRQFLHSRPNRLSFTANWTELSDESDESESEENSDTKQTLN